MPLYNIAAPARASLNFNGVGGASIRKSHGITSVTRNSSGYYTIASPQISSTSVIVASAANPDGASAGALVRVYAPGSGTVDVIVYNAAGTPTDTSSLSVVVY